MTAGGDRIRLAPTRPGDQSRTRGARRGPPRLSGPACTCVQAAVGSRACGAGVLRHPAGAGLPLLFGGADQHLIDRDMPRPGNDIGDGVGDVRGLHPLPELAPYALGVPAGPREREREPGAAGTADPPRAAAARPGRPASPGAVSTFRARAADQAHVASMPGTTWPVSGHPPGSSRGYPPAPVLMPALPVTTRSTATTHVFLIPA